MHKTVHIDEDGHFDSTPTYLFDYSDLYKTNPNEAGIQWFLDSHFTLGFNFGLHALLGKGQNAMRELNIQKEHYENLLDVFKMEHFDPIDMVQFTVASGARALELTVKGPDGFCLWNTETHPFNVTKSPAQRDILAEIASVCEYEGIGLCIRYSLGHDWRHKPSMDGESFFDLVMTQLKELLINYGPIAAVNFDGMDGMENDENAFPVHDAYHYIHSLQAQTLISFQHGANGEEDFFCTDFSEEPKGLYATEKLKPVQLRETMTPGCWGYNADLAGKHLRPAQILGKLKDASAKQAHLLLNVNLMPDGSLDLEDINALLEVGKSIQEKGFPT